MEQINIFDLVRDDIEITKPIRLIELFAGYGSQAMALERIGANFEHYRVVEFDKPAIKSYNAVHGTDFPDLDIRDVHAEDLGIVEKDKYTYILTYMLKRNQNSDNQDYRTGFQCALSNVEGLMAVIEGSGNGR